MLAIDADGRIIDDSAKRRSGADRLRETVERPVGPVRRDRHDDRLGAVQRVLEAGIGARAVEDAGLDARGAESSDAFVRARRAAGLDQGRSPDEGFGAIAEAEEEDFHLSVRAFVVESPV